MNSPHTDRNDAARQDPAEGTEAAAGAAPSGGQGAGKADGHGDTHATAQAALSVMHPESHDPEWRYYYGAAVGG